MKVEFERLKDHLPGVKLGLLHGQLPPVEKERVMTAFRDGEVQVLLSTSVVEVGVDVPNATVMLIENAERFGLAQLHQLRGRIGRGEHPSYCVLWASQKASRVGGGSKSWRKRRWIPDCGGGFSNSWPGQYLWNRAKRIAAVAVRGFGTDFDLLSRAREDAKQFIEKDSTLAEWSGLLEKMRAGGVSAVSLVAVS